MLKSVYLFTLDYLTRSRMAGLLLEKNLKGLRKGRGYGITQSRPKSRRYLGGTEVKHSKYQTGLSESRTKFKLGVARLHFSKFIA